jgi:hypothetical protein
MEGAKMQLQWIIGSMVLELGSMPAPSVINDLPEEEEFVPVYACLAKSRSALVRRAVATKEVLSAETVALLASDSEPDVIKQIVNRHREKLSEADLTQIIKRGWSDVNTDIASRVEEYRDADVSVIAKLLAESEDPWVRAILAANDLAPKAILKQLTADPDGSVRRAARKSLKR